ncbi:hypothetical protein [Pseudomonas sp. SG20052]|uniref:hypothetical protein n=1 Tax=Pseudomonas sp. SG20052 TaxID=3074147 RepID=UPI00287F710C|nr:hypothetical protein [Pseudomonas sp. SG20052]WNF58538.1 hypothetical protein RHP74_15010 [Pseudomonas sp. SG20052]
MSAYRAIAMLGVAVVISTAAYSAHFVGEQIEYLHQKLSPSTKDLTLATEWPNTEMALPKLEGHFSGRLQTTSQLTLTDFSTEEAMIHLSR